VRKGTFVSDWLIVIQKQSDVDSNCWSWIGWFLFLF